MPEGTLQSIIQPPRRKMGRQLFSASFLLLFLFMVLMPSTGNALPPQNSRCECTNINSSVSPRDIHSVHLIQAGSHCNVLQVKATLKDGSTVCLDPTAEWVKRIVQVLLNRENH